jgi:hypothetical protein
MSPRTYEPDPVVEDAAGTDEVFVAAAKTWAADPEDAGKITAIEAALTADLTPAFAAVGLYVAIHQADGTDAVWCYCVSADAATYTAAALNAWLAIPHALP